VAQKSIDIEKGYGDCQLAAAGGKTGIT